MKRPEIVAYFSILLGLVGYQLSGNSSANSGEESVESERTIVEISNQINHHLVETSVKIESAKLQIESYQQAIPRVGDQLWPNVKHKQPTEYGVDQSSDISEDMIYQDLNRHKKVYTDYRAPRYVVENSDAIKQNVEVVHKMSQKEFVAQFVENARKKGYLVHVNSDLVVTSVEKIKEPNRIPTSSTQFILDSQ